MFGFPYHIFNRLTSIDLLMDSKRKEILTESEYIKWAGYVYLKKLNISMVDWFKVLW